MFFRKKEEVKSEKPNEAVNDYFRYRDSLSGQMNKQFAVNEFDSAKKMGKGAVLIHVVNTDNMPYYLAVHVIAETAQIIASIAKEEISRVESGDFLIYSSDEEDLAERATRFLKALENDEVHYVCVCAKIDQNDTFSVLVKKLNRRVAASEGSAYIKSVRDLPIR